MFQEQEQEQKDYYEEEDQEEIDQAENGVSQSVKTLNFLHKRAVKNHIKSKPLNELLAHLNSFMKDIAKSGTSLKNTLRNVDIEKVA